MIFVFAFCGSLKNILKVVLDLGAFLADKVSQVSWKFLIVMLTFNYWEFC